MATKMETILERAKFALTSIKTLGTDIPDFAWKRCKGIAIITVSETGFVFGSYAVGDGVVLKKNADGTWTPPMAVKFTGPSVGLLVGKQTKQIILLPMTDAGMTALASMDRVNLGVQIGLTAGPVGNEAQLGFTSGSEGSASVMYSYTFSDGVFANIGINGYQVQAADEVNEEFYGKHGKGNLVLINPGAVAVPEGKGVEALQRKLTELSPPAAEADK